VAIHHEAAEGKYFLRVDPAANKTASTICNQAPYPMEAGWYRPNLDSCISHGVFVYNKERYEEITAV